MIGIASTTSAPVSDGLVELAARGDERAFTSIVERHHHDLIRVAFIVCGDGDLAEQAAVASWPIVWRKLHSLREPARFRPWLYAIAANEARQLSRRQRRRSVLEIAVDTEPGSTMLDPAARIEDIDLAKALDGLSADDRALLALRYVGGLNSSELGRATGRSASGTRARLQRLLAQLRKELQDD